ncbi:MAG: hypothetical protein GY679_01540 [Mycoplasma sp.]|nr:hypothetical protein [Mycoplasma sp.]
MIEGIVKALNDVVIREELYLGECSDLNNWLEDSKYNLFGSIFLKRYVEDWGSNEKVFCVFLVKNQNNKEIGKIRAEWVEHYAGNDRENPSKLKFFVEEEGNEGEFSW